MIIVTGASGKLGHAVVEQLLDRVPADQVGVSVRDPDTVQDLADRGVRVRHGHFEDPASLAHSFEGATRVLVVSINSTGPARIAMHRTAIEAARDAGAQRVFYTSHAGAAPQSPFPPMPDHYATEEILHGSGASGTALRGGFYADSAVMFLGDAVESGELSAPEDGPVNWTTHEDLSAAMAAALADPELNDDMLELTGSETLDLAGVAAIASELSGRPIRRTVVSDDDFREAMVARGAPPERADMALGIFRASRQGAFTRLAPTLEQLIGRPPMTVRDVLGRVMAG